MLETQLTEENISKLVNVFYAKIRKHKELGPIFNNAIHNWEEHLIKLTSFWKDRMLNTREFIGNPPRAHLDLPKFDLTLFEEWLKIFHETVNQIYIPEIAELYVEKSKNIAFNLQRILSLKS